MSEGFKVKDKGLTTDAVRILRLPDTTNFKGGLEADVTVLKLCNGQVKQDTLLSRLFIKFPLILNRGLIA